MSGNGKLKIGILGGTFDPVHNGHLAIAAGAKERVKLDKVLFVPAGKPWMKSGRTISSIKDRVKMVQLAIDDEQQFEIDMVEVQRKGITYTIDTLENLKKRCGENVDLYFIMGSDSFGQLPVWKQPERIVHLCRIIVVPRLGCRPTDITALEKALPGIMERVIFFDGHLVDVSATGIREMVRKGQSLEGLLPENVERYIREKGLYLG